jgi:heme exporter protein D
MAESDKDRRLIKWTMWGVLLVVIFQLADSIYQHGELIQKVAELSGRVARIEAWIDTHTVVK